MYILVQYNWMRHWNNSMHDHLIEDHHTEIIPETIFSLSNWELPRHISWTFWMVLGTSLNDLSTATTVNDQHRYLPPDTELDTKIPKSSKLYRYIAQGKLKALWSSCLSMRIWKQIRLFVRTSRTNLKRSTIKIQILPGTSASFLPRFAWIWISNGIECYIAQNTLCMRHYHPSRVISVSADYWWLSLGIGCSSRSNGTPGENGEGLVFYSIPTILLPVC